MYYDTIDLILFVVENGRLPILDFASGGIATSADAALMMQLGCDGIFVGSGILTQGDGPRPLKNDVIICKVVKIN